VFGEKSVHCILFWLPAKEEDLESTTTNINNKAQLANIWTRNNSQL